MMYTHHCNVIQSSFTALKYSGLCLLSFPTYQPEQPLFFLLIHSFSFSRMQTICCKPTVWIFSKLCSICIHVLLSYKFLILSVHSILSPTPASASVTKGSLVHHKSFGMFWLYVFHHLWKILRNYLVKYFL
jgi:hypothetical protein